MRYELFCTLRQSPPKLFLRYFFVRPTFFWLDKKKIMAYARKYRRRTGRARRPFRRKSTLPAAIRPKKTLRRAVRKNYYVNKRQTRLIRTLWNRQYGAVQKSLQNAVSQTGIVQPITVGAARPVCWNCTDFTCYRSAGGVTTTGCRIWGLNVSGNNLDQQGYWTTSYFDSNPYWAYTNRSIVDGGRYKPIAAYYTIDWTVVANPTEAPPYLYLHLFSQKKFFPRNNVPLPGASILNLTMPFGLVHMKNMANGDENRISTEFFKVYKVKKIATLRNLPAADATVGAVQTYRMHFSVHPKKVCEQLQDDPMIPGTHETEGGQTELGSFGAYNVDPSQPLWALLSSSDRVGDTDNYTNCKIMRKLVWRDVNSSAGI